MNSPALSIPDRPFQGLSFPGQTSVLDRGSDEYIDALPLASIHTLGDPEWVDATIEATQLRALIVELLQSNYAMQEQIGFLAAQVSQLQELSGGEHLVAAEVRPLSDDDAKSEIKAYFKDHHGEVLYADDVAEQLGLDVMQSIRLCAELYEDGEIAKGKEA